MRGFLVALGLSALVAPSHPQSPDVTDVKQALAKYDAKVKVSGPDAAALAVIARDVIRRDLASEREDAEFIAGALERLAGAGDTSALEQLKQLAQKATGLSDQALAPVSALARLGDGNAQARLGSALASAQPADRVRLVERLQDANAKTQAAKIRPLLADPDPQVRCRAALALGVLHDIDAVPALKRLFANDAPIVQAFAGAALKRMGDSTADAFVANILRNGLAEARLIVAQGYQDSRTPQWTDSMRELLTDRDPLMRIRVAELIACCAREAARATLIAAVNDAPPPLRASAAAALERSGLADMVLARRLVDDPLPAVRLHGAGATLSLAKSKTAARPPR